MGGILSYCFTRHGKSEEISYDQSFHWKNLWLTVALGILFAGVYFKLKLRKVTIQNGSLRGMFC